MDASTRASTLLPAALVAGGLWGCFSGEGSLGAFCADDAQCGPRQRCSDSICGMCKDHHVQAGELCFGNSSEEAVMGQVVDLLPLQPIDEDAQEGVRTRIGAVVNLKCPLDPSSDCWGLYVLDNRDGDFETSNPTGLSIPGTAPQAVSANFDGAGRADVALVVIRADVPDKSTVAVLFDFPNALTSVDLDVSLIAATLHAADLDGDGLDDLLLGGASTNALAIVPADPNSATGFGNERIIVSDPAPRLASPADIDGDGSLDLIVASAVDGTIGVNLNDGFGNFSPQPRVTIDDHLTVAALEAADLDGDGFGDVVVFAPPRQISQMPPTFDPQGQPSVYVFLGDAGGDLTLSEILDGGENPVSGLLADLNADGWIDVLVADQGEDKLPVYINRAGSFPDRVKIDVAAGPRTLLLADFDSDGVDDIIIGNANGVVAVVPSEN